MSVNVNVQSITKAEPFDYVTFSTVKLITLKGEVTLFFELGKARKVADAINEAIGLGESE